MTAPVWRWSLRAVRDAIAKRQLSPVEVVQAVLDRIESRSRLNAYITVMGEAALAEAHDRERALMRGDSIGPLFGVPIGLKDNIATAGIRTTAGSPTFEDSVPGRDADLVQALRRAGAIVVGKNNLFELAFGAAHPRYGETLNPWNPALTCGGSSSGSAAAVADGQCFAAIGTDTGGSIRIPAAMCGIVGLKPSRDRISIRGIIPVSPELDVAGPMTRSVEDAELVLSALGGPPRRPGLLKTRLTVGVPAETGSLLAAPVAEALELARRRFVEAGCAVRAVQLPDLVLAREVMWTIASAEVAAYHRQTLMDRPEAYCEPVRSNLVAGSLIPAVDYIHAQRLRLRLAAQSAAISQSVDVVLLPAVSIPPYPSGAQRVKVGDAEDGVLPLIMGFTPLANLTGQPAVVVPVDVPKAAPPATVQLYGEHGCEDILLHAARLIERGQPAFPE
jgi:aspartyl-tRNA(Asn)/glutamyl-tRNA(Gln) amidotransferase subunit A